MHFTKAISLSLLLSSTTLAVPTDRTKHTPTARSDSNTTTPSTDDYLPPIVPINPRSGNTELIQSLLLSPLQSDRAALLNQPGDYIFDFTPSHAPPNSTSRGAGGVSTTANAKTMPALIGNGASMTLGFLGPCGMNTAHVHNRATELNVVVQGRLVTNFVLENGAAPVQNTLSTYQMAVFPQGAIHQEFNPDCDDAVFVAGFNNADHGVSQVAQNFFSLREDVVRATLGGLQTLNGQDIESFRELIPANVALGIEACLEKCGLTRHAKRDLSELL
ncbi:RmlC-like cupin domain-containing protein [Aspergillus egyptiacus]|nr:RmlC-like cupin domain-containing protein [Aspergillus egyptiacus]